MFGFYQDDFCGTQITEEQDFYYVYTYAKGFLEHVKASRYAIDESDEAVKKCLCALCDLLYLRLNAEHVQREQWDGYMRTYAERDLFADLYEKAKWFLPPEALYRGVEGEKDAWKKAI